MESLPSRVPMAICGLAWGSHAGAARHAKAFGGEAIVDIGMTARVRGTMPQDAMNGDANTAELAEELAHDKLGHWIAQVMPTFQGTPEVIHDEGIPEAVALPQKYAKIAVEEMDWILSR